MPARTAASAISDHHLQAQFAAAGADVPFLVPEAPDGPGQPVKFPVRIIATSDVATLSGEQTVDGYSLLEGHRVLLTNQTTGTEMGIWVVHTGAWTRAQDANGTYNTYAGIQTYCRFGTHAGETWVQTLEMTDFDSDEQIWQLYIAAP